MVNYRKESSSFHTRPAPADTIKALADAFHGLSRGFRVSKAGDTARLAGMTMLAVGLVPCCKLPQTVPTH